jgi:hypothetical protein
MKQKLIIPMLFIIILGIPKVIAINCGDTWQSNGSDTTEGGCTGSVGHTTIYPFNRHWTVFWVDSAQGRNVTVTSNGVCVTGLFQGLGCISYQSAIGCNILQQESPPTWRAFYSLI